MAAAGDLAGLARANLLFWCHPLAPGPRLVDGLNLLLRVMLAWAPAGSGPCCQRAVPGHLHGKQGHTGQGSWNWSVSGVLAGKAEAVTEPHLLFRLLDLSPDLLTNGCFLHTKDVRTPASCFKLLSISRPG